MKILLSSLALLALTACGAPTAPDASAPPANVSASEAPASKPDAEPPTSDASASPQAPAHVTAQMLHGRWGDSGDCSKDIVFNPDGGFRSYTGGFGRWSLSGDTLTLSGIGGTFALNVRPLDANTIEINNPDGSVITSNRC